MKRMHIASIQYTEDISKLIWKEGLFDFVYVEKIYESPLYNHGLFEVFGKKMAFFIVTGSLYK